jgi:uncharacterized Ntn-hydrolase superfamily protein
MTFSIVAWDEITASVGIAIAGHALAIGSLCAHVRGGAGALAVQAYVHPEFAPRALNLLALNVPPESVLELLLTADEDRDQRQLHAVDALGNCAAYTGSEAQAWAGHKTYPGFSVAGNLLFDEKPLGAMAAAYMASSESFPERLMTALTAGQAAGGDRRGSRAAALAVAPLLPALTIDLRVDDHPDPVTELQRIFQAATTAYGPLIQFLVAVRKQNQ